MSKTKLCFVSALVVGMTCLAAPRVTNAASMAMLQTLYPLPGEADPTGGNVLFTITVPVVATTFTGTLTSTVIANDSSNPLSGLTFTYLLTNDITSQHPIGRMTINGYESSLADVSYLTPSANRIPTLANRSVADVIGFSFLAGIGPGVLSPGMTSALMVIQTDASAYGNTLASIINGSVANVPSLSPVPEPGTAALCGIGALFAIRRRRAR